MERSLVVGLVPGGSTKQATITITWTLTAQEAPAPSRADPWAEDPAVQYNVERINEYRARAHLPPLLYDAQIAAFARTGSARLSRDHVPHANFVENGRGAPGFSSRLGENQGDPNGVPAMSTDPVENWRLQIDFMLKDTPLRRLTTAEDIGRAVVWFSSPQAARQVTGQLISVSGGYTMP